LGVTDTPTTPAGQAAEEQADAPRFRYTAGLAGRIENT
jgi:hypothetical protein